MQEQAEEEERLKRQEAIDGQYHSVVFYSHKSSSVGRKACVGQWTLCLTERLKISKVAEFERIYQKRAKI